MKICVIGGGPGGLYFAILAKLADPNREIVVLERNERDVTFGWGVVFSDETLEHFLEADPISHQHIRDAFVRWDAIDTTFRGETIRSTGHGFCGIERKEFLRILTLRAESLGIDVRFGVDVDDAPSLAKQYDLVVAADGVNSKTRDQLAAHFQPDIENGAAKYIWLGADTVLPAFTFAIRENEHGLFQAHAYPFSQTTSTFIVECDADSWARAGLDSADEATSIAYLETLFAPDLKGAKLMSNHSHWIAFRRIRNATWHHENIVLLGDAAHTAHFSIGSGTKLAMEDSIALAQAFSDLSGSVTRADVVLRLARYQESRWVDVAKLQKSAKTSREWFEQISRYRKLEPIQFVAHLMSRSKRITHENLRKRDPALIDRLDRWFTRQAGLAVRDDASAPPPMFVPLSVGGIELSNRVVVSPMCQYSAREGIPGDWHYVHLGALARGGAGLVMAEMTAVCEDGRITRGCTGLYSERHVEDWAKVLEFCRQHSSARMGIQLGHAGRKGSTSLPWEGDRDLGVEGWPIVGASDIAYSHDRQIPRALGRKDMIDLREHYVQAARRADRAGFDWLEVHMAHGYLLATFISPLTNQRSDDYGGSMENRARFPLEILDAVRQVWPEHKALSVRISASDWAPGGLERDERLELALALKRHGCDLIDVSSGQTVAHQAPDYGRMFQTKFSDEIRNEVGILTMAVGAISNWDQVNTIVATGRADLCALARPHLRDPHFTLNAAIDQGYFAQGWPSQYLAVAPRHVGR